MRKISIVMIFCMIFNNNSYAYIVRNADVKCEKVIPFSFIADVEEYEDEIRIKGAENIEIEEIYVENGEVNACVEDDYICFEFYNGKKTSNIQNITKIDTLEIENMPLSDEENKNIQVDVNYPVKEILEVNGDFKNAIKIDDKALKIEIQDNIEGINGYDKNKKEKTTVVVNVNDENVYRKIDSEYVKIDHEIIGDVELVSEDTSIVEDIIVENNMLKVTFNNGEPKLNDTTINNGYTFFWIDRDSNGIFKKYNPNSIYTTDRNKITGEGTYLDEKEVEQLGMTINDEKWIDYCGVEVNGIKYIYPFDKKKGIPNESNGEILSENALVIKNQEFNTEKYKIEFSKDGVTYIPEGKLYSMGELVDGTSGWGEVCENKEWESKETFFNKITGKTETYVKHYKFFYGPDKKKAFGGHYTYPYECTLQYEHYKPVKLYSGQVVYSYDKEEYVKGYLYNGWVKISYTENKTINDYPPTSPYNVRYDDKENVISWEHGLDDYTKTDELSYEIQVYTGLWGDIIVSQVGENNIKYDIDYSEYDIRVRTKDEVGQVSEWSNMSDNFIELSGEVSPNIIKAGDMVSISAKTKSLSQIECVEAKCSDLGIDCKLEKIAEDRPQFFEMSYDIVADFLQEDEYIYTENTKFAKSTNKNYNVYSFNPACETNKDTLIMEIPKNVSFSENGTLIIPNDNYLNSPLNIMKYDKYQLYLHMTNEIGVLNKITGKKDIFIAFENGINTKSINYSKVVTFVPKLHINTFNYDEEGNPKYISVELDREIANKPIVVRWNTDVSGLTRIDVKIEDKDIYSYFVSYETIEKYVEKIDYVKIIKYLKRYVFTSDGYGYPNKRYQVSWADFVLAVLPRPSMYKFPWLGYRVNTSEYIDNEYILKYNNNPAVRNTYRTLILDEYASDAAVNKYIKLIKETNFPIEKNDGGKTIFGDDVLDYNCEFKLDNIITSDDVLPGKYEIELTAYDTLGKSNKIKLPIIVENDEKQMYPEEDVDKEDEKSSVNDVLIGRFFYKNGEGFLEELKRDIKNSNVEGFICAGETIGVNIVGENIDYIEIDLLGDNSIKHLDNLTKLFLIEKPRNNGKNIGNIENEYDKFPKKIYPTDKNEKGEDIVKYFYVIPYGTKQTINSWSTLKDSTLGKIDKTKLFTRIAPPYELKITINGDENNCLRIPIDVFERWDTVLNRNISNYVINRDSKWKIRIEKQ